MEAERRCYSCLSDKDVKQGWIMPPGKRINKTDTAKVWLCRECREKGSVIYPWWGEADED